MVYSLVILLSQFWTSCSMSDCNCCFLTHIQISQEAGQVVWYSHLFKNFSICWNPHEDISVVNEAELNVFLELLCFLHDSVNIDNLISCSPASLKPSLNIWNFSDHVLPSWITALSWWRGLHNSVKLWAMLCKATQDGQVMVRVLTKHGLLEEEMATHSSILARKIPWTEEPCGL